MVEQSEKPRVRYDEGCLAAHALNVIGDRWALLVVRELMFATKRFQAIRSGLPGITASVLTRRIAQLLQSGVLRRAADGNSYGLTASGRELLPVLQAMCRWGALHPGHDPSRFISPSALVISMTAMSSLSARSTKAGLDFGDEAFVLQARPGSALQVRPVRQVEAPFILTGTGNQLARAVYGAIPLSELVAEGRIGLTGDLRAAQEFLDQFRLR